MSALEQDLDVLGAKIALRMSDLASAERRIAQLELANAQLVETLEAMLADDELVLSGGFHDRARAALARLRGEPS